MSYSAFTQRQRRFDALKLMHAGGGDANELVLLQALRELGYPRATRPQVREDLDYLREAGLIHLDFVNDTQAVGRITERGIDCVEGRIEVEGVARPQRAG